MKKNYLAAFILLYLFSVKIFAQCTTTSVVPCIETFQSTTANNQLPTCWASSSTVTCLTYTAGSHYASFFPLPAGVSYYYTNAIQLTAGITYSASIWYQGGGTTWTNLSLLVGPNQSVTGLVSIASTTGNAQASNYTALSNTFVVTNTGTYYIATRGTSNGNNGFQDLLLDDLSITMPCTPTFNTPSVGIVASATYICAGDPLSQLTFTANGANTYSWNTGATTATTTGSSLVPGNTTYIVTGTSSLTGCASTASIGIIVKNAPAVLIIALSPSICVGSSVNLMAFGGTTYTWSNGQQGVLLTVSPAMTTTYIVIATNSLGCTGSASQQIGVNPLPVVSVSGLTNALCPGEPIVLNASGAATYIWNSGSQVYSGSTITYTTLLTSTLTVSGSDANNCTGQTSYVVHVDACTGLKSDRVTHTSIKIYPNPGNGEYKIDSGNNELKSIVISDITGKIVFSTNDSNEQTSINLQNLSNGIYQARISSGNEINYLKIIKQ